MSNEVDFIKGDSRPYTLKPTINNLPFNIDPLTCVVKAAVVSNDKKKLLSSDTLTLLSTTPGSNWVESTLIVKFPRSYTVDITNTGPALIEIQITFNATTPDVEGDDWTWFFPINLVKGNIL